MRREDDSIPFENDGFRLAEVFSTMDGVPGAKLGLGSDPFALEADAGRPGMAKDPFGRAGLRRPNPLIAGVDGDAGRPDAFAPPVTPPT